MKKIITFLFVLISLISFSEIRKGCISAFSIVNSSNDAKYDAEVEWLESTGTQYIDTGYYAKPSSIFYIGLIGRPQIGSSYVYFGASKGDGVAGLNDCIALQNVNSPLALKFIDTYYNDNDISYELTSYLSIICNVSTATLTVNGFSRTDESSYSRYKLKQTAQYPIYLFGMNLAGTCNKKVKCKIYYWKVFENNELKMYLIPCRIENVGYMYDRVSGKLFGNNGTGEFIVGQDL